MKFTLAFVAAAASSAVAFTINTPESWTTTGPNSISFSAVSSDPETFAITLSPQTNSNNATIIAQSHSSSETTFDVTADCDDLFPEGSNYVLNFIRNATSLTSVLAQSQPFNISTSTSSSSCNSSSSSASSSSTGAKSAGASSTGASASAGAASASATGDGKSAGFNTMALPSLALLGVSSLAFFTLA